jgi:integrase
VLTRAKRAWGLRFDREPDWRPHMLKEADERVRELHEDEAERLDAAMRDDYAPLFDFVRATGQRKSECYLLRWAEVDWGTRRISRKGKGGRTITVPITDAIREILWPLRGHRKSIASGSDLPAVFSRLVRGVFGTLEWRAAGPVSALARPP